MRIYSISLHCSGAAVARRPKRTRPNPRDNESEDTRGQSRFGNASHKYALNLEKLMKNASIIFINFLRVWGSQMAFNNHHTPPASQEYERPPPYYYPGPSR